MSKVGFKSTTYTKYDSFLAGNAAYSPITPFQFESIATLNSPSGASFSLNSIPQTFKHLQLRYILRDTGSSGFAQGSITVNSSGASNMAYHKLSGDGATVTASAASSEGYWSTLLLAAMNSTTAGTFAAGIIDILDYTNTNKNKTMRILAGGDGNGSGQVLLGSGFVDSTTAISSITFYMAHSAAATNSQFALYGIKG